MQTSSCTLSVRLRLPSAVGVWAGGPEPAEVWRLLCGEGFQAEAGAAYPWFSLE